MARHVWRNYEQRAFGRDELKPVSGRGVDSWGGVGQTLVDSLDTLWMMGLREEFDRAASWAEDELSFEKEGLVLGLGLVVSSQDLNVNYFETSIRHLGGLLSAYIFSRRPKLLTKALDLASRLSKAFPQRREERAKPSARRDGFQRWLRGARHFLQQVFVEVEEPPLGYAELELEALEDLSGQLASKAKGHEPLLPLSDVNLRSGKATDLAGYLSLSAARLSERLRSAIGDVRAGGVEAPRALELELRLRQAAGPAMA